MGVLEILMPVLNVVLNVADKFFDLIFPPSEIEKFLALGNGVEILTESSTLTQGLVSPKFPILSPAEFLEIPNWVNPIFRYHNKNVSGAIWELKYRANKDAVRIFGEILYLEICRELKINVRAATGVSISPAEKFLLIPVPTSTKKRRQKGFNQTELLSKEIFRLDQEFGGENFKHEPSLIRKITHTKNQADIKDRDKRLQNLKGAFRISPENHGKIFGQNIILIDDVFTTGATLSEIATELRKAGAQKIKAFTIAH